LPGVKEQVAEIIALIGRHGVFSTYTLHDISHIDALLKMLDWLIPGSTRSVMTPIDWLLSVLSIYLHDLGMVVTEEEYEKRMQNPDFTSWRNGLEKTDEGREYLARTNRMSSSEKEQFFFQEFIRKGHPQRIREWVTGRHTRKWSSNVKPIAHRIEELLKNTPPRFRDYLGIVCESHHRENLDKVDIYPLAMRFGNDHGEIANIQYAAILLRTADLLHITKDRTPSVMYKTIRFSDPKSVEEWGKQLGTFSVGSKGRKLIETDSSSAVIVVNADFTEERPLFALQEYIAYADSEINQSNRWAEKSRELPDGKGYSFPWHNVDGDVRLEGVPPQSMRFELDRGQLLDLLVGHTIYNEPTVAIRELLQNAIDAVRYQAHLDRKRAKEKNEAAPNIGKVVIKWDSANRLLGIQDDGVGMDRDIIRHHLMNVGSSYYNTSQFESENRDFVPISRFGIGILTCFMVSDDIEIVTCQAGRGHRIRMTSVKSTYLLRELYEGDPLLEELEPHGTRVQLRIRDTVDLNKRTVLDIVKYWVILPECQVEYQEIGATPTAIGFASPLEAIRSYSSSKILENPASGNDFIVKSKQFVDEVHQTGCLELAFGVISGYFPERSFLTQEESGLPKVCIEGIRVSDRLPGFESSVSDISALLAVSGSRQFRTTVSREGLEIDNAYRRIGKAVAELFFEHVRDEASRLANKAGRPLSQSATGSKFLIQQLLDMAVNQDVENYLIGLADNHPSIVLEEVNSHDQKPVTTRKLISPMALNDISNFWTIESRSVDSLSIISLDLGRELSLNEFLIALAPDITQLRYSPLIPSAERSRDAIHVTHSPERVEFSRIHQQTAIRWNLGEEGNLKIHLEAITSPIRYRSLLDARRDYREGYERKLLLRSDETPFYIEMCIADVLGDDPRVKAVSARMGSILQRNSDLHLIWKIIQSAVISLAKDADFDEIIVGLHMAVAFSSTISPQDRRGNSSVLWRNNIHRFRAILNARDIKGELPDDIRDIIESETVFNATAFWRDWENHS
jgi:molecular chaperone HtpG